RARGFSALVCEPSGLFRALGRASWSVLGLVGCHRRTHGAPEIRMHVTTARSGFHWPLSYDARALRNRVPRVRGLPIAEIVARARAAKTGCRVQLPRQTAHRIFAGERWTTLHGVNADFCHAFAPLGEFFAESKISRLI